MKNPLHRICLALVMALSLMAYSQTKPLKIGNAIPATVWTTPLQVVNAPQKTTTLSADKGKLILLDFWSTWCGSCLKNFPHMEELQKKFGDRIKIQAVSKQDRATLEKFFASTNGQRYKSTISVSGDKMFSEMFPHLGVPFIIWIKDGKLLSTTDSDQVNEETIARVLRNEKSSLQTVIQIGSDRPLMLSENFDLEKGTRMLGYFFMSKGRIRAAASGTNFRRDGDKVYGRQFTNLTPMEVYKGIAYEIFEKIGDQFSDKRVMNLVNDPIQIDFNTELGGGVYDDNRYNVELIVPKDKADSLYMKMLKMINENTSYMASVEKHKIKCLVLVRTSSKDKLNTKGGAEIFKFSAAGAQLQNAYLKDLVNNLEVLPFFKTPFIDGTDYQNKVDLSISGITDLKSLRAEFSKYDLNIEEQERELNMLVVRDK